MISICGSARTLFHEIVNGIVAEVSDPAADTSAGWFMPAPLNRVMLCGDAELPAQADLDRYADAGARAFLAAYGPH